MDGYSACEEAYKKGYDKGYKDGNVKEIPKKPIGDLHSVPHYRCPTCNNAIVVYKYDYKYPHCKWCGQAIDWSKR